MTKNLSRRSFVKAFGAVAAVGAVGGIVTDFPIKQAFAEGEADTAAKEVKALTCKMCMAGGCQGWVDVENGVPVGIHGDDEFSYNQGSMCMRGKSTIMNVYNPYRVTAPMKRTNPLKGIDEDPGWVEISWDEALETTAKNLKEVSEEDPRQIVMYTGFALHEFPSIMGNRLSKLLGITNQFGSNGALCAIHYSTCLVMASMPTTNSDMTYCKYLIDMGRSVGPNFGTGVGNARSTVDAQVKNGMRHIVIDPHCSIEASMGEWVPIRVGGDLAFVLAMAHVMFYEIEKYDEQFLKHDTNAPYLIGSDGLYIYSENKTPLVWDLTTNEAVEHNKPGIDPVLDGSFTVNGLEVITGFKAVRDGMKDYTPEWAEEHSDIPAAKIREIAQDFVEAASIGTTININGKELRYRPVGFISTRGAINHGNGTSVDLMTKVVCELVGSLDVPGGIQGAMRGGKTMVPNDDGVITPFSEASLDNHKAFKYPPQSLDLKEYFPHKHEMNFITFKTMADPKAYGLEYEVKAMISAGGNPMLSSVDNRLGMETVSKIPFKVELAYHYDESAHISDILLPVHSHLEYEMIKKRLGDSATLGYDQKSGRTYLVVRDPIKPIYDTKSPEDIVILLADKMGKTAVLNEMINKESILGPGPAGPPLAPEFALDPGTVYSMTEIWDRTLQNGFKMTLDELKQKGYVMLSDLPLEEYYNYYTKNPIAKYQFYFASQLQSYNTLRENLDSVGADVPGWTREELEAHYKPVPGYHHIPLYDDEGGYELYAFNYKILTSMFRFEAMDQNALIVDYSEKMVPDYKKISLNAKKAAELGIASGDEIIVESRYGSVRGQALCSQLIQEKCVGISGAMGRMTNGLGEKAASGIYYNDLLTGDFGTFDPVMGAVEIAARVKVYKV